LPARGSTSYPSIELAKNFPFRPELMTRGFLLTLSSRVRAILHLAKILCIQFPLYRGVLHSNVTLNQVFVVVSNTERVSWCNCDPET
jgi:hypothetical protein